MPQPLRLHRPAADVKAATIAALAMGKGQLHAPDYATADYSGWCDRSVIVDLMGYGHGRLGKGGKRVREGARTLSLKVRCRKCDGCRKERRMRWTERAAREWRQSTRSWLVTLTFTPAEHYRLKLLTRQRIAASGGDIDAMPPRDRLVEHLKEYGRELERYLMRLRVGAKRKGWAPVQFRYLGVAEPHKSGEIHYHLIIHEQSEAMPIVKRRLEETWRHGIAGAKLLVDEGACRYACKYLGKYHFEGRMRASMHYGETEETPEEKLAARPFPGVPAARPARPLATQADREAEYRADLGAPVGEEEADLLREGDPIGVCPTGLHQGVPCTCVVKADQDHDAYGLSERGPDELRSGVARRKWSLRGWHTPAPGRGAPGVPRSRRKAEEVGESVH